MFLKFGASAWPNCLNVACLFVVALFADNCFAGNILTSADFYSAANTNSGNGTLDLRLFTTETAHNKRNNPDYNGDDGNDTLPKGTGQPDENFAFAESYATTVGKLLDFYTLNFGRNDLELVLFFDINETTGGGPINHVDKFQVILGPTGLSATPTNSTDLDGSDQGGINQVYGGGTELAALNGTPVNLPMLAQGGGYADYSLHTGIFLNTYAANTVILFNLSMSSLDNGGETIFLSGNYAFPPEPAPFDSVPEPASLALLLMGSLGIGAYRVRRKA